MTKEQLEKKIDALSKKLMILQLRAHVLQDLLQKAQIEYLKIIESEFEFEFELKGANDNGENA